MSGQSIGKTGVDVGPVTDDEVRPGPRAPARPTAPADGSGRRLRPTGPADVDGGPCYEHSVETGLVLLRSTAWPGWVLGGCLVAFLAGSVPFGLLLGFWFGKTDVRRAGSGNIGATNVARVVGRGLGLLTLVLDAVKGFLPVWAARFVWPPTGLSADVVGFAAGLVGLSALLGHCFPPWLRFRGGKGVATGLGVLFALYPSIAFVALVAFAIVFAATRLVSAGSLLAVVVVVALVLSGTPLPAAAPLLVSLFVIVVRHADNIRRLVQRRELPP